MVFPFFSCCLIALQVTCTFSLAKPGAYSKASGRLSRSYTSITDSGAESLAARGTRKDGRQLAAMELSSSGSLESLFKASSTQEGEQPVRLMRRVLKETPEVHPSASHSKLVYQDSRSRA